MQDPDSNVPAEGQVVLLLKSGLHLEHRSISLRLLVRVSGVVKTDEQCHEENRKDH